MKIYEFSQNNSGGSFVTNEELCHRVFIEAENYIKANKKAKAMGIYFDGCSRGKDCSCCGDRWYPAKKDDFIDNENIEEYGSVDNYIQDLANEYGWTTPDARIFYKNGDVKEFFKKEI